MLRNVKTYKNIKFPDGWEIIQPQLEELQQRLRDAENEPSEGKRKPESVWPILKIHHQINRLIFNAYQNKEISKELLNFCIRNKIADGNLIAKWKKPGYEKLCCLLCIQKKNHNFGTTCICRVPKIKFDDDNRPVECLHCGCRGCASTDI